MRLVQICVTGSRYRVPGPRVKSGSILSALVLCVVSPEKQEKPMNRKKRSDVNYMEFRDGYVLVKRAELEAIIEGYKRRELRRNELRLYAAMCEQEGLHWRKS